MKKFFFKFRNYWNKYFSKQAGFYKIVFFQFNAGYFLGTLFFDLVLFNFEIYVSYSFKNNNFASFVKEKNIDLFNKIKKEIGE